VGTSLVEVLHVWFGLGANGKSTTANVIQRILGKYAGQAAPNLLVQNSRKEHPTEIADLCGKRLAFSSETAHESRLDEAKVKQLTGGDVQKARFMRKDFFEFKQTWTLFLLCNHKPAIQGTDNGIWRRVKFIPWSKHIEISYQKPQDEVINTLLREKSGILNWLIEGLADYYKDPKWVSETVSDETDLYRSEQDMIRDFLEDCCQIGRMETTTVNDLYEVYQQWCTKENERPQAKKTFGSSLKGRGGIKGAKGTAGVRLWKGLSLKPYIIIDHNTIQED
jgi:putative DNA primase/helicase